MIPALIAMVVVMVVFLYAGWIVADNKNVELRKELEVERMRLAAAGTAALGYFKECKPEYHSATLSDVLSLRQRFDKLRLNCIELSAVEVQSGLSRVRWAEGLIKQLPKEHEGRNSWLALYGEK